jgi:hypothetical protein
MQREGKCRVFSLESADKLRTASSIKSRARTNHNINSSPREGQEASEGLELALI